MRGLDGAAEKAVAHAIEMCFLSAVVHQSIDTLSKGYKHRTCLAQALIHDPEVLVLDEPTDGLDPNQKHEVRNLIRALGKTKAVVFSTHILEEVDAACTRAIIIDRGRIVAQGNAGRVARDVDARRRGDAGGRRRNRRETRSAWTGREPQRRISASIPAIRREVPSSLQP
jgi:ABC-2 type transport system ATP-binding protein